MNLQDRSKGTRIMPSILLQLYESQQKEPKKILLPKKLSEIKAKAIKLFNLENQNVVICDVNGIAINDIHEIKPGKTVYISISSKKEKKTKNKNQPNKEENYYYVSNSDESYSDETIGFPTEDTKKVPKKKKSNLPIFHSTKRINQETEQINSDSEASEELNAKNVELSNETSNTNVNSDDNNDYYIQSSNKNEEKEENDDECQQIIKIFDDSLPNHNFSDDIKAIIHYLPKEYLNFAKKALDLEEQQKDRWFNSLLSIAKESGLSFEEDKIEYYENIREKSINIIKKHFFASQCGLSISIKTVIDGPAHSGKTVFLSILLNEYIKTLSMKNMWKNNFLIILNCEDFAFNAADIKLLYFHFVKVTIEHLKAQVPEVIPHSVMLQKYFETIVEDNYLPVLPKKFTSNPQTAKIANAIRSVSLLINQNWHASNGRESFCTIIFLMPVLVARNYGFKDITLFIDHLDLINLEIEEMLHFPDSEGDLFLIEYIKNVLAQTNFVISSKDSKELCQCFSSFDECDIELADVVSFESILDIECQSKYDDSEIYFTIDKINYKLNASFFGGVPLFLIKWVELNELIDNLDETDKESIEYEEKKIDVINYIQSLLPIIFTDVKENASIRFYDRKFKSK